ncbi:hypothetical protein [Capillimicrobium parvum]|uniref:Uncharacterized protein n=1 Tax=Capillimicrobium parvum TaxID=2884022 RepID=A0A9E6Y2M6_9ACTN|nr:hypothetical protein [Capillimicrobium parvum]UGS38900.1 hypothetical protein DSM104329_05331 [Capillimicrobium parvum]
MSAGLRGRAMSMLGGVTRGGVAAALHVVRLVPETMRRSAR